MTPEQRAFFDEYLKTAHAIAWKWCKKNPRIDFDEIDSVAVEALWLMAIRLDEKSCQGERTNWVSARVFGAIVDYVRSQLAFSRPGYARRREILSLMEEGLGIKDVASKLKISVEQVEYNFSSFRFTHPLSLDQECSNGMLIQPSDHWAVERKIHTQIEATQIWAAVTAFLHGRRLEIFKMRFIDDMRLQDIADVYEVSEGRICQILTEALNKIRGLVLDGTIKGLSPTGEKWKIEQRRKSAFARRSSPSSSPEREHRAS